VFATIDAGRTPHLEPRVSVPSGVLTAGSIDRGELVGLRWVDVDLEAGSASVRHSITATNGQRVVRDVKTKVAPRRQSRPGHGCGAPPAPDCQLEQRVLMVAGWRDSGLVFTAPTGAAWNADSVSRAFERARPGRHSLGTASTICDTPTPAASWPPAST
jgi:hypothetical protein